MKGFITSMIILLLIIGVIAANRAFLYDICESMEQKLETSGTAQELDSLCSYWESKCALVSVSVSEHELNTLTITLHEMKACFECGDTGGFEAAKARASIYIDAIRAYEEFGFDNIF